MYSVIRDYCGQLCSSVPNEEICFSFKLVRCFLISIMKDIETYASTCRQSIKYRFLFPTNSLVLQICKLIYITQ